MLAFLTEDAAMPVELQGMIRQSQAAHGTDLGTAAAVNARRLAHAQTPRPRYMHA